MSGTVQLIAGLGNPGEAYRDTRHNAGFWFVDALQQRHGGELRPDRRHQGEVGQVQIGSHRLHLIKPTTFMNRSGAAIASLARFHKVPVECILIVHDELDLSVGVARLKMGGGHGGHNGLRSIISVLGSPDFRRLRLGIGHPGPGNDVVGYVLRRPSQPDLGAIRQAMDAALAVLPLVLDGEVDKAMQCLHTPAPN